MHKNKIVTKFVTIFIAIYILFSFEAMLQGKLYKDDVNISDLNLSGEEVELLNEHLMKASMYKVLSFTNEDFQREYMKYFATLFGYDLSKYEFGEETWNPSIDELNEWKNFQEISYAYRNRAMADEMNKPVFRKIYAKMLSFSDDELDKIRKCSSSKTYN